MKVKEFVTKFYGYAKLNEESTGVPALITLAQAALESGWGKHIPGNNFFGIKDSAAVDYGVQNKSTKEFVNGKEISIKAKFETYPSPKECFEHHAKLLKRNFPKAFKYKNPHSFIYSIQNEHFRSNGNAKMYATDPEYVSKISSIISMIAKELPKVIELNEREQLRVSDIPEPKPLELLKFNRSNSMSKITLITQGDAPNVELGIDEVLDIVDFAKEVKEAHQIIMEDGKVTPGDFIAHPKETIIDVAKAAFKVWEGKELILPQLESIDLSESDEIIKAVVDKLGVTNSKAREIIDHSVKGAYHIYAAIRAF